MHSNLLVCLLKLKMYFPHCSKLSWISYLCVLAGRISENEIHHLLVGLNFLATSQNEPIWHCHSLVMCPKKATITWNGFYAIIYNHTKEASLGCVNVKHHQLKNNAIPNIPGILLWDLEQMDTWLMLVLKKNPSGESRAKVSPLF